jgi:hypothetical protein
MKLHLKIMIHSELAFKIVPCGLREKEKEKRSHQHMTSESTRYVVSDKQLLNITNI